MNARSKIFWLLWMITVIAVKCPGAYISVCPKTLHSPKCQEQVVPMRIVIPGLPAIPELPPDVFYFAAKAFEGISESDFSVEVVYTNSGNGFELSLAWNETGEVDGFRVYKGWNSRNYDTTFNFTTNLFQTVWLYHPPWSNCVVTVTSQNATNLQWTPKLGQSWSLVGSTNWTGTNIPNRYWRAVGRSTVNRPKVFINRKWQ